MHLDLLCCFSHSAHWLPARKKQLYTVANPTHSWSAEQGKKKRKKSLAAPPPPRALLVRRKNEKQKKISRGAASTCLGATQVGVTQVVSVRRPYKDSYDSSARPMGVASQNSTLPCAIATFPVSLPLSSPGDFWPRLPLLPSTRP